MSISMTDITKLFLFGTTDVPEDLNERIVDGRTPIQMSMNDFLTNGAGHYANPARANGIQQFFDGTALGDGTYTWTQVKAAYNLTDDDLKFTVSQYETDINSTDYVERSYIYGSTGYTILSSQALSFSIVNGQKSIQNMELRAFNDNFDYEAGSQAADAANILVLTPTALPPNPRPPSAGKSGLSHDGEPDAPSRFASVIGSL